MLRRIIKSVRNALPKAKHHPVKKDPESSFDEKPTPEKTIKSESASKARSSKKPNAQPSKNAKQHSSDREHPSTAPEKKSGAEKPKWDLSQFPVPPSEGKTRFHDLNLPIEIMHGIFDLGFEYCSPIQAAILPKALTGMDANGRAQTGTGKSAAFLITILTRLMREPLKEKRRPGTPRALILLPTRELALQVKKDADDLGKYCRCNAVAVFGGMDYVKQKQMLADKLIDIVMATPGRLLDFKRQGDVHLGKVEILVLDEADHMLDMGFIPDVRQIIHSTPQKARRQTMLFGATLTPEVSRLAAQWTRDPFTVDIEPEKVTVDTVDQIVYLTTTKEKFIVLYNLITREKPERIIIFCNRRDQTRRLAEKLRDYRIRCAFLSGEVGQKKRISTLEDFRAGKNKVLVATDVAGRGIHVDGISHVVNYHLPLDPEDYVHRIGRTGRAGVAGTSISFATENESFQLPDISEFIGNELPCVYPEDELLVRPPPPPKGTKPSQSRPRQPQSNRRPPSRSRRPRKSESRRSANR